MPKPIIPSMIFAILFLSYLMLLLFAFIIAIAVYILMIPVCIVSSFMSWIFTYGRKTQFVRCTKKHQP
jgi:hypothetical protein